MIKGIIFIVLFSHLLVMLLDDPQTMFMHLSLFALTYDRRMLLTLMVVRYSNASVVLMKHQ